MSDPMRMFETGDLNETFNFDKITLMQKTRVARMIFRRQRDLVIDRFQETLFKTLLLAEINFVEREHFQDIVFALKGIISFGEVKNLYVSFF